jgi:wobble nucleotide-excising tRNase
MKVNEIKKIEKVGCFNNFDWKEDVKIFRDVNIIYGPNSVGKTTISNLFRASSKNEIKADEIWDAVKNAEDSNFELSLKDSSNFIQNTSSLENKINSYVFNEHFITDYVYDGSTTGAQPFNNNTFEGDHITNPTIKDINEKLNLIGDILEELEPVKDILVKKFNKFQGKLSNKLRENINRSGMRKFNINSSDPSDDSETEQVLQQKFESALSAYTKISGGGIKEDLEEIKRVDLKNIDLKIQDIKEFLENDDIITHDESRISKKVEEYQENEIDTQDSTGWRGWFDDASILLIHESSKENKCPVCNQKFEKKLLQEYKETFDKSYQEFVRKLDSIVRQLEEQKNKLDNNKIAFSKIDKININYSSYQLPESKEKTSVASLYIDEIIKVVNRKRENLNKDISSEISESIFYFESFYNSKVEDTKQLKTYLKLYLDIEKTKLDSYKSDAQDLAKKLTFKCFNNANIEIFSNSKLEILNAGIFSRLERRWSNIISNVSNYEKNMAVKKIIERLKKINKELRSEKNIEVAKLRSESRNINKYLKKLGIYHLNVDIEKKEEINNIYINHEKQDETNNFKYSLSQSEKTCIAFAYFLSKIQHEIVDNKKSTKNEVIIVIDDPVSSLDDNRLYKTACEIEKFFFYNISENEGNSNKQGRTKFSQFFLLSHNLKFLKFFSGLLESKKNMRSDYYLHKNSKGERVFEEQPDSLRSYQTLYFTRLKEVENYLSDDGEERSYEEAKKFLPNYIRSVMETFIAFKYFRVGNSGNESYSLKKLINVVRSDANFTDLKDVDDVTKDNIVEKLDNIRLNTNDQSHGSPQHIDSFSFISKRDLDEIATDTINIIRFLDPVHYNQVRS